MRKIEDINVLLQFEQRMACHDGLCIIKRNELTKEEYLNIKENADLSETTYSFVKVISDMVDENDPLGVHKYIIENGPTPEFIEKTVSTLGREKSGKGNGFYERRVDERFVYNADMLLAYDYLPEDLLRTLFLKKAKCFVLVRVDELYVSFILS